MLGATVNLVLQQTGIGGVCEFAYIREKVHHFSSDLSYSNEFEKKFLGRPIRFDV